MNELAKENMHRIRILTDQVTPFSDMATLKDSEVKYLVKAGECQGRGLMYQDGVAVQWAQMGENTDLLCHVHDAEVEYLVVYEGMLTIHFENETRTLQAGDCVKIEKGVPHNVVTSSRCLMIAITIPASKFYPKEKDND
jgi:mannose-6-phosphate isomerase-like protein (cupin superfamily)